MPIIFSTIPTSIPVSRPDQPRVFFQAPDDALLASVVAEVASILGRHQAYVFHEPSEVPAGLVPVVLGRAGLAPDTGRTQEAPRRAFWRLGDRATKVPERPVGEADYSSLEQRVLVQCLRDATDAPLAACRQALIDAGGDHDRALALMRTQEIRRRSGKAA